MIGAGLNAPPTSSCGRWFNAACGLLGVRAVAGFEGEAPMVLESLVRAPTVAAGAWSVQDGAAASPGAGQRRRPEPRPGVGRGAERDAADVNRGRREPMCLAVPARVVALLDDDRATVNLGGVTMPVSLALVEGLEVDDYVIVHVGYALTRLAPPRRRGRWSCWRRPESCNPTWRRRVIPLPQPRRGDSLPAMSPLPQPWVDSWDTENELPPPTVKRRH